MAMITCDIIAFATFFLLLFILFYFYFYFFFFGGGVGSIFFFKIQPNRPKTFWYIVYHDFCCCF